MGDVNGKHTADTVLQYSWGSSLIRDSQRCLSTSSAAWFGSGADYCYKSAGAVRQTDRETHREAAALARQCQLCSCKGLFCSAKPPTLPQLIGVASLAWAVAPPICSN